MSNLWLQVCLARATHAHVAVLTCELNVRSRLERGALQLRRALPPCSTGTECGIMFDSFHDVRIGDVIESYEMQPGKLVYK